MQYNNIGGNPTPGPVFSLVPNSLNFGEVAYGQTETTSSYGFKYRILR